VSISAQKYFQLKKTDRNQSIRMNELPLNFLDAKQDAVIFSESYQKLLSISVVPGWVVAVNNPI
jgi:hypothetical protein